MRLNPNDTPKPRIHRSRKGSGKARKLLVGQSYNHFDMFETLGSPYDLLGRSPQTTA